MKQGFTTLPSTLKTAKLLKDSVAPQVNKWKFEQSFFVLVSHLAFSYQVYCKEKCGICGEDL